MGTLFVALGFSVIKMLIDVFKTLRQMVRKMIYKCRVRRRAKKDLDHVSSHELEDTVRMPIVRKKSEKLEEIREEDEEEEDEEVVKDVSFETENQEASARVDIKPVIILLSHNSAVVPKVEIQIEDLEKSPIREKLEDIEDNQFF